MWVTSLTGSRILQSVALSVLLCATVAMVSVLAVSGQESTAQPVATTLALQTAPLLDDKGDAIPGRVLLIAMLATGDDVSVSEQEISFFERIEFIGEDRNASLGSAITDVTGTAVIAYQPSTLDDHTVWAKFGGDDSLGASESDTALVLVDTLSPTFESEGSPLESVRRLLPWGVGLVVFATWAVVLGALVRTVLGVRKVNGTEQPA